MTVVETVFLAMGVLGPLMVLSASEVLGAGSLAPRCRRHLERATRPLFVVFCLVVGRQLVEFI